MTISRIRVLGILPLSGSSYYALTDIWGASTLDLIVHDRKVTFGAMTRRYFSPPRHEEMPMLRAEVAALEKQWRSRLNEMLTAGEPPDAYAAFGASALQLLGLLPDARWICVGRSAVILGGERTALPLDELIKACGIQEAFQPELSGSDLEAWQAALLFQDHLRRVTPKQMLLFSAVSCRPCLPPPPIDDHGAWARVPDCDLLWLASSNPNRPDEAARASRERRRRMRPRDGNEGDRG